MDNFTCGDFIKGDVYNNVASAISLILFSRLQEKPRNKGVFDAGDCHVIDANDNGDLMTLAILLVDGAFQCVDLRGSKKKVVDAACQKLEGFMVVPLDDRVRDFICLAWDRYIEEIDIIDNVTA